MRVTHYPLNNEADLPRILDLVRSMPDACQHIVDLPWRLGALDLNGGCDAAFWEDMNGRMVGFAACQYVWATLDFFILPGPEAQAIAMDLFAWAHERFQERKWPYPYRVEFRDDDHERQQLAKAYNFLPDEDLYVLFQHALTDLPLIPTPPDGFQLRPLMG
jgi:mycothiol synthase